MTDLSLKTMTEPAAFEGVGREEGPRPSGGRSAASPALNSGRSSGTRRRRLLFFSLVALSTLGAAALMADVMEANGFAAVEIMILGLFTINFAWIAISFWTAAIGFAIHFFGGRRAPSAAICAAAEVERPVTSRTAIVMPIYGEDVRRVYAGIEATYRSLAETGELEQFDFFVLSDTRDPEAVAEEKRAWTSLCLRLGAEGRIFYRRRAENLQRKAGNIADFCRRWGRRYDHMLVLDADSVMSGATIVKLARLMEANPSVGIIQTLPIAVNRETPFARIIQFASRLYGPILASGLSYWQQGDSNYWGHNAIIRVDAFIRHCGLPVLPGRAPLGGEILSHDFVEAALMRRAGLSTWLLPDTEGSYEEVPPNLVEYAARDRRWCQGNLQHLRILFARRLHSLSRVHLLMGVMSYASSLFWLLLLACSTADILTLALVSYDYFPAGYSLFPAWPQSRTTEALGLLAVTIGMLMLPKIFALVLTLGDRAQRRAFGGAGPLLASAFLEQLVSMLQAPVMMLFHARFVITTLLGMVVKWTTQQRDDRLLTWAESFRAHRWHMAIGLAWGGAMAVLAPDFIWWLSPVIAGLVVSVALSRLLSDLRFGRWLRERAGLFLTPEELSPPPVLQGLRQALAASGQWEAATQAAAEARFAAEETAGGRPGRKRIRLRRLPSPRPCEMASQCLEVPSLFGARGPAVRA